MAACEPFPRKGDAGSVKGTDESGARIPARKQNHKISSRMPDFRLETVIPVAPSGEFLRPGQE